MALIFTGLALTSVVLFLFVLHLKEEKKFMELINSDYHKGKKH